MTTLKVRFDGRVLVPEQPVDLPQGRVLEIQVADSDDNGTSNGNGTTSHDLPPEQKQELDEYPLMALVEIANSFPDDPDTPTDLAAQHDHYLHGMPKRP